MNKQTDCYTCVNLNCLIKKHVGNEEVKAIVRDKHTLTCKKSQQFIMEGAPIHGLYFIYKGRAKVTKTGIEGREQIVRFANDGDIVGHRGFGTEKTYPIGATALEDITLCTFTSDTLFNVLHKAPAFTFDVLLFYADELNKSENRVRKFAQMSVREKVIDGLLYLSNKFGQTNKYINIILSRRDIADFAGTTEEQVIRIISSLKKEKLIVTEGKKIGIANPKRVAKEMMSHNYI